MNLVILKGNLAKEPELSIVGSKGTPRCKFSVGVKRAGTDDKTDFINCVAWKGTGETISKYFKKGDQILVQGEWNVDKYNDTYFNTLNVRSFEFCGGSKPKQTENKQVNFSANDFNNIDLDINSDDIPF